MWSPMTLVDVQKSAVYQFGQEQHEGEGQGQGVVVVKRLFGPEDWLCGLSSRKAAYSRELQDVTNPPTSDPSPLTRIPK